MLFDHVLDAQISNCLYRQALAAAGANPTPDAIETAFDAEVKRYFSLFFSPPAGGAQASLRSRIVELDGCAFTVEVALENDGRMKATIK